MKTLVNYQKKWDLTDKEYIYLLEGYYFSDKDRFEAIAKTKGFCYIAIPDNPPYALWFKDGVRISQEEGRQAIYDNNKILQIC